MKIWVCFAWVLAGVYLLAQEPINEQEESTKVHETITVTAEKQAVSVDDTAASVTVVDDAEIAQRGVHDVQDLLRFDPSVTMDYDATRTGAGGFRIRGIGGNRVLTQIDGAPVVDGFAFGPLATPRFQLDPSILKAVEVVKGPGSALYGSDALAGVVSFVTKDPVDILQGSSDFAGDLRMQYDDRNQGTAATANVAMDFGQQALLISAGMRDFSEQQGVGTVDSADGTRTLPNPINGRALNLLIKGSHAFSEASILKLSYERFDESVDVDVLSGQGTSVIFGTPTTISDFVAEDQQTRDRVSLRQTWSGLDSHLASEVVAMVYAQRSKTEQFTSERRQSPAAGLVRQGTMDFEQQDVGLELTLTQSWSPSGLDLRLTYGLVYDMRQFEQLRGRAEFDLSGQALPLSGYPTRYFPPTEVEETGVYAQLEMLLLGERLRLVPGVRYDRFELQPQSDEIFADITEDVATLKDDAVSPKLGLRFDLGAGFALAGQVARGFRAPPYSSVNSGFTNLQSGYQTLPNPALEPETSTNVEGSLRFRNDRFSGRVTYFENRYRDFIQDTLFVGVSQQGIALFQSQNIDRVDIEGWELNADWRLAANWMLQAAWSELEGRDLSQDTPLTDLEPSGGHLGVAFDNGRFDARLTLSHRQAAEVAEGQFAADSYEVIDTWFGYRVRQDLRLLLSVYNLADETYYPFNYVRGRSADDPVIERYAAPGRNAALSVQFKF